MTYALHRNPFRLILRVARVLAVFVVAVLACSTGHQREGLSLVLFKVSPS